MKISLRHTQKSPPFNTPSSQEKADLFLRVDIFFLLFYGKMAHPSKAVDIPNGTNVFFHGFFVVLTFHLPSNLFAGREEGVPQTNWKVSLRFVARPQAAAGYRTKIWFLLEEHF